MKIDLFGFEQYLGWAGVVVAVVLYGIGANAKRELDQQVAISLREHFAVEQQREAATVDARVAEKEAIYKLWWDRRWQELHAWRSSDGGRESRSQDVDSLRAFFRALRADDFEHLVADLLRSRGWKVDVVGGSGDHGIDLVAAKVDELLIVQCKKYNRTSLTPDMIREFIGARAYYLKRNPTPDGVSFASAVVTTFATVTLQAQRTARENAVEIRDWHWLREEIFSGSFLNPAWRARLLGK